MTLANRSMWPALGRIWAACFGDDDAYIDFLFDRLLCPEHILVDTVDGRPAAMLCIEPATLVVGNDSANAAYIYGVATLPEYQGGGRSTALLAHCHEYLVSMGCALSMLVPAGESLFRFYAKRGYETAFWIDKLDLAAGEMPGAGRPCSLRAARLEECAGVRERVYAGGAPFVRWGADYLRYIGDECVLLGGEVLHTVCGGEDGYAVCYRHENDVVVKELAVSEPYRSDVMAALHAHFGAERYRFYLPVDRRDPAKRDLPFAMVRWYDKEKQSLLVPKPQSGGWIAHVLD